MAQITLVSKTSSSLTVKLTNLDTSWSGGKRVAKFYVNAVYKNKLDLWTSPSETQSITLSGLAPSTTYNVMCIVYDNNDNILSTLTKSLTTSAAEIQMPTISDFTVEKYSSSRLRSSFSLKNVTPSTKYTFTITVDGKAVISNEILKTSNDYIDNYIKYLSVDATVEHTVKLTVWLNTHSVYKEVYYSPTFNLDITNITYYRVDGGLYFSLLGAGDATSFDIKLVRNYDNYTIYQRGLTTKSTTFYGLKYGIDYTVSAIGYRGSISGNYSDGKLVTTAPAQPTLISSTSGNQLIITAQVSDSTNVSKVEFTLYDSTGKTKLQTNTETVDADYMSTTDKISTSFSDLSSGKYIVKARTIFVHNSMQIQCVDDNRAAYYAQLTVNFVANNRPTNFAWTYAKTQGGNFNLTAVEWNNYTARINEFREYKGLSKYSFTQAVKGNDFTAAMYNQARTAIRAISGYGTYIPQVAKGDTITAYMMNILVSELNAIQ